MPYKTPEKARIKSRERMREKSKTRTPEEKEALSIYGAAWWAEHKDEQKMKHDAWYAVNRDSQLAKRAAKRAADPEHFRAHHAADYAKHAEERRSKEAVKRAKNPEFYRDKRKAWRLANPEKHRAINKRRKALKAGSKRSDISLAQWLEVLEVNNYRCVYCPPTCKECRNKSHDLTQDHITPVTKGGEDSLHNVVPSCVSCNSRKHTGPPPVPVQPLLLTIAKPIKKRKA